MESCIILGRITAIITSTSQCFTIISVYFLLTHTVRFKLVGPERVRDGRGMGSAHHSFPVPQNLSRSSGSTLVLWWLGHGMRVIKGRLSWTDSSWRQFNPVSSQAALTGSLTWPSGEAEPGVWLSDRKEERAQILMSINCPFHKTCTQNWSPLKLGLVWITAVDPRN